MELFPLFSQEPASMECLSRRAWLPLLSRAVSTVRGPCESSSPWVSWTPLVLCADVSNTCVHAAVFVFGPKESCAGMAGGWHHLEQQEPQDTVFVHYIPRLAGLSACWVSIDPLHFSS